MSLQERITLAAKQRRDDTGCYDDSRVIEK